MIYECRVFRKGKLKKVYTSSVLSKRHWEQFREEETGRQGLSSKNSSAIKIRNVRAEMKRLGYYHDYIE